MWKQFTAQGNTQYLIIHVLLKILKQYNNTKHSSIKMTPVEASKKKNKSTVYFSLYGDMEQLSSKPRFKVGDKVRISKYKRKGVYLFVEGRGFHVEGESAMSRVEGNIFFFPKFFFGKR